MDVVKILETQELALPGLKTIKFAKFGDERGYFCESFRMSEIREISGFEEFEFHQANESFSKKNVVRGLHFQWNPKMGKLVRTIRGHMVDIALDIRKGSPTLGKVIFFDMPQTDKDEFGEWIWLPPGFAHGNFFLEDTVIEYFCTAGYNPKCERGISVFSADLDFSLADTKLKTEFKKMLKKDAIISEKDKNGLSLSAWKNDPNFSQFLFKS